MFPKNGPKMAPRSPLGKRKCHEATNRKTFVRRFSYFYVKMVPIINK